MPSFHYCKDSKAQGTHAPLLMCLLMCSSHQKAVAKKPKISRHIKPSPISLLISSSYKCCNNWSCFLHCKTRWIRPVGSTCWYLVKVLYVWYVHAVLSSEQHACWPEVVQWLATCTNRMCQSIVKHLKWMSSGAGYASSGQLWLNGTMLKPRKNGMTWTLTGLCA